MDGLKLMLKQDRSIIQPLLVTLGIVVVSLHAEAQIQEHYKPEWESLSRHNAVP